MSTADTDTSTLDRGDDWNVDDKGDKDEGKSLKDLPNDADDALDKLKGDKDGTGKSGELEDEDEDEDKDEAEAKTKNTRKDTRIPLARHQQMLERERTQRQELERKLAQYEKGDQVAKINADIGTAETKLLDMEKQHAKFMADGEVDKAADLMTKIRQAERSIVETKSEMRTEAAVAQAVEKARYGITLERIEESYPALDQDRDEFDQEKYADVVDFMQVYMQRGQPPSKALQNAVKKVMGAPESKAQEIAVEVKARVSEKDVAAERRKAATKKAAEAVAKQPSAVDKAGLDHDKAGGALTLEQIMAMDQGDFAKLSEKELAKFRGDEV